jgi:alpha-L-fucosidase
MKKIVKTISILCLATFTVTAFAQTENLPVYQGKFKPTDESLKTYNYPEWSRDVKCKAPYCYIVFEMNL